MKILFVLPSVPIGGVGRVRLTLIEYLRDNGVECRLALRHCRGELLDRAQRLAPVHELAPRGIHQFVPALARLIRDERATHVVTAFSDVAVLCWAAMRAAGSRAKWIHSVHNTHAPIAFRAGFTGRIRSRLENCAAGFAYRRAAAVITVSEGVRGEILNNYHVQAAQVKTIYNPVVPDGELQSEYTSVPSVDGVYRIATVGRLVRQKGYDVLVRAVTRVPGNWRLDIWGVGPEQPKLAALIQRLGMAGRIHLRGYTSDPYGVLRGADLFVMSSRHEGLPATLIEALACRCQVVATDCLHGPREILRGGKLGQLVPVEDVSALRAAIVCVMSGRSRVAPECLLQRARDFTRSACCQQWETVLRQQ